MQRRESNDTARAGVLLRRLRREDGSGLVEFAIVFILYMTMILGVMDFARALYVYHFVSHVAREATRYAAVNGSACTSDGSCTAAATQKTIGQFVQDFTPPGIDSSKIKTTATWPGNGTTVCTATVNSPTCPVDVEVSYTFNFMFSWIRKTSMTLSSTSEMIISH